MVLLIITGCLKTYVPFKYYIVSFQGFCRTYNSHLATIETERENIFLTDTIALIQNGVGKRDIHDLTRNYCILLILNYKCNLVQKST